MIKDDQYFRNFSVSGECIIKFYLLVLFLFFHFLPLLFSFFSGYEPKNKEFLFCWEWAIVFLLLADACKIQNAHLFLLIHCYKTITGEGKDVLSKAFLLKEKTLQWSQLLLEVPLLFWQCNNFFSPWFVCCFPETSKPKWFPVFQSHKKQ